MQTNILKRPILTERSMSEVEKGRFTFEVFKNAGKDEIKNIIQKRYKVKVLDISTQIIKGRSHRVGTRRVEVGKPSWKKAIVQLEKGQKIDIFEVGS